MPATKNNHINISQGKKVFFVSDHHFGLDTQKMTSLQREKKFVNWLNQIKPQAEAVFILGDMFDYWYEYKKAVPKAYTRLLGKLAEFTDSGIPVYFFVGNHDMWMLDYFEKELNIPVFFNPDIFTINNKLVLLGHGDGLGPGDKGYKFLKKIFTNKIAQFLFRWIHPDWALPLIKYFSQKNKFISGENKQHFHGEKEFLFLYAKQYITKHPEIDYFVFGHRHLPLEMKINNKVTYFNTGDWLVDFTYVVFDGQEMQLKWVDKNLKTN